MVLATVTPTNFRSSFGPPNAFALATIWRFHEWMRPHLLLALTASLAFIAFGCSDDGGTGPAATDDTGAADTSVASDEGVDTSVAEDSGGINVDTGEPMDTSMPPADTMTPVDTMMPDVPLGDGGPPNSVRIHELKIDRAIEGDRVEFIELSGAPGTNIGTLWIRALKADGTNYWKLRVADTGTKMPASGLWVIGTATISRVNKIYSLTEFGLENDGGSVQLTDDAVSSTTLVDVVGYGGVVAMASTDPKQTYEGTSAMIPASGSTGKSIGRKSVPGDSNNNRNDLCVQNETPGLANGACL